MPDVRIKSPEDGDQEQLRRLWVLFSACLAVIMPFGPSRAIEVPSRLPMRRIPAIISA